MIAERLIDQPATESKPARKMREYNPVVELLSLLADRIGELILTVAATKGMKGRKIPPTPRPVTALERLRQHRRRQKHTFIVSKLLPHKAAALGGDPKPELPGRPQRRMLPSRAPQPGGTPSRNARSGWSSP